MIDKPRRSWFRFSLRTLLVLMTVLCCWLAWESSIVRQRKALLAEMRASGAFNITPARNWNPPPLPPAASPPALPRRASISWVRRCLGDEAIQYVWYFNVPPNVDMARVQRAFPETEFREVLPEPCHPGCFPRGTLVDTPEGRRHVESIQPGDLVTVITSGGSAASISVQSVFVTQNKLLRIETEAGELLTTPTQPLCIALDQTLAAGELAAGYTILRYQDGEIVPVKVLDVAPPERIQRVFNLVLGNRQVFVAGGYLARSKPPLPSER